MTQHGPSTVIRPATPADAAACAAIYRPYVENTAATFELQPPSTNEFRARIAHAQQRHSWLVAERGGVVIGYAYGHEFSERAAYARTCEASVYVSADGRGGGVGRALYQQLMPELERRGMRRVIAVIVSDNAPSIRMHERMGFRRAGELERVGFKFGRWHSVTWMQLDIGRD